MEQIFVSAIIFTAIVVLLSAFVLVARRNLAPVRQVAIDVNEQRTVHAESGRRLLWALADNDIHLPAACGGRGTCGQCTVQVTSGVSALLPTEAVHILPDDAAQGYRLACMLKLRDELSIAVPQSVLNARRRECTVVSNRSVATYLKELVLKLPDAERLDFQAGDYILLKAPPHRVAYRDFEIDEPFRQHWLQNDLHEFESHASDSGTRAYSLANPPQDDQRLVLIVRIAIPPASAPLQTPPGQVSSYIFGLKAGDTVSISGPYGEFHANDSDREMVLIAGGAGIAPIRSIVLDQLAKGTDRKMSLWYGSRNLQDVCYAQELEDKANSYENFSFHVALSNQSDESGWLGSAGLIHKVVYEEYLKTHPAPGDVEYYLCGPPLMSAAVLQMLDRLGVSQANIFFDDFGT